MSQHVAFLAPVDLGLGSGDDLEAAMQPGQPVLVALGELGDDPRSGLGAEHLDPLVVALEAVLGDQPLVDHAGLQRDIGAQPRLDDTLEPSQLPGLGAGPRRAGRWDRLGVFGEVLLHSAPVTAALAADLGVGRSLGMQGAETTDVHPGLLIKDHEAGTLRARLLVG